MLIRIGTFQTEGSQLALKIALLVSMSFPRVSVCSFSYFTTVFLACNCSVVVLTLNELLFGRQGGR
jgi:hypothetical protein